MTYTNPALGQPVQYMLVREESCVLQDIGTCQDVRCADINDKPTPHTSTGPQKTPANDQKSQ